MKRPTQPRKIDRAPGAWGFKCGGCGKRVKPYRYSFKREAGGWHWHKQCWSEFLTGKKV